MGFASFLLPLLYLLASAHAALPVTQPEDVGMSAARLRAIGPLIDSAIARKVFPSAVVVVVREGKIVYRGGFRTAPETVFDLASLTKVVATAPAVLALLDSGELALSDRLQELRPGITGTGTFEITLEQLLRHRSGYPAGNPMSDYAGSPAEVLARLDQVGTRRAPGSKFVYSDVGFLQLGRVVEQLSGERLDRFVSARIFAPLEMRDTGFRPLNEAPSCERCAPTSPGGVPGRVHDGRALALEGIAGHAGVFSTADDLAVFAQMILGCGEWNGVRVLSRATVRKMMELRPELPEGEKRGLGWDIDTPYSIPRGEVFPVGSFGHTGYTGTSVWIDPSSATAVILLANRSYFEAQGPAGGSLREMGKLRRALATLVAKAIVAEPRPRAEGLKGFCSDLRVRRNLDIRKR
ncbi:MAG: serine hydrolase [Oligoflexia bacterium]|nr:serine hydrolase [Oligoflexia bacterium]